MDKSTKNMTRLNSMGERMDPWQIPWQISKGSHNSYPVSPDWLGCNTSHGEASFNSSVKQALQQNTGFNFFDLGKMASFSDVKSPMILSRYCRARKYQSLGDSAHLHRPWRSLV